MEMPKHNNNINIFFIEKLKEKVYV